LYRAYTVIKNNKKYNDIVRLFLVLRFERLKNDGTSLFTRYLTFALIDRTFALPSRERAFMVQSDVSAPCHSHTHFTSQMEFLIGSAFSSPVGQRIRKCCTVIIGLLR